MPTPFALIRDWFARRSGARPLLALGIRLLAAFALATMMSMSAPWPL